MNLNHLSGHSHVRSLSSIKESEGTIDPGSECHSSDFGESACGEPLAPQRLIVDFTPNDEDTEFIQKKCCAFWDFITSCPELQNFIVLPEPNISDKKSRPSDVEFAPIKTSEQQWGPMKTAVSMLEFVEEKGLITRAFEAKLPQSGCSAGSQDYFTEPTVPRATDKEEVCRCNKDCTTCNVKQAKMSSEGIRDMCRELRDWDALHPKSMDPPGHAPAVDQS